MVDVVPVSALDGKENSREQRSAGKRSRDSLHDTISKRPALACLSNHVDSISERQQRDTKKVSHLRCRGIVLPATHTVFPAQSGAPLCV